MQPVRAFVPALARGGLATTLLAATLSAQALPQVNFFSGQGQVAPTGIVLPNGGVEISIVSSSYAMSLAGQIQTELDWHVESLFVVEGLAFGQPGASSGQGQFVNGSGDSISFTFTGAFNGLDAAGFNYTLTYDVTGGSGRFAGADGTGWELVAINPDTFSFQGAGDLDLVPGGTVPAPATLLLLAPALLWMAARGRRLRPRQDAASPALST